MIYIPNASLNINIICIILLDARKIQRWVIALLWSREGADCKPHNRQKIRPHKKETWFIINYPMLVQSSRV